ncbi:hypothetical protein QTP86_016571 [Hemibagrus guttatus]|nr:hypothetical protein QTP86_016571 [Hemibagrus guttatus]
MQSCVHRSQDQSRPYNRRDRPEPVSPPEPAPEPAPEPMQRRLTQSLCLYCGDLGHALPVCPIHPPRPMVSTLFSFLPHMKPLTTHGTLTTARTSVTVVALLDSGSVANFVSGTLCRQLGLWTKAMVTPYQIRCITGKPESMADIILGCPWLEQHNPILSWSTGEVLKWGDTCFPGCFPHLPAPHSPTPISLPVQATSIESPLAPLLIHPDPDKPFVVEVDASTTGVGAVLSQQQGNPGCLHPCAFFSHKLNLAERNYDIGNRELLAIKLALEEWRHWLEGARHPFLVLTDHKNLEYLRAAKRLIP